jgi:EAL domain-containing protein (putative c-di-GMP-specific phosphodiesterase class I)
MEKMHESEDPERSLRLALANEEFELFGQPIVSVLQPGRFPMAEVLVRMRAEEDYMLPPGDFIPVFEHYGMMPELDRWVSAHAIRMLARSKAIPVLCLNLHPQTFLDEGFAENMAHELSRAHVEGSSLVFEFEHEDILADENRRAAPCGRVAPPRLPDLRVRRGRALRIAAFHQADASDHHQGRWRPDSQPAR